MKKTLLLLASAALLLVGCAKEQIAEKNVGGEGLQTVSFTVGVESAATKAVADEDGKAANINHWIMQVLDSDGDVYNYQEKDGEVGVKTQTFTVPLVKGQTYQVLFWADTKGNYVVSDLRDVKRAEAVSLTANRDDLDAFSAVEPNFSTTQATSKEITLKRPFAQLNVVFTDLKKLYDTMGSDAEFAKFKPTTFVAKAKVPTTFDVLHQTAGSPSATVLAMNAAECYNPSGVEGQDNYTTHTEKATLYMDYILATAGSKDIVDIDFSFVSKGVTIAHNFASIPFQRNYRTNIIGELMSAGATWNVVVDPEWTGENDWTYVTEGSVAAAIEALAAGKTAIEITSPADFATPVAIPAEADGKDISIKVTGVTGKEMTFKLVDGAQGPANLYITTDAQDLVINLPNSHVEVNGGTYQNVEATTSATTLLVGKDVTIDALDIKKGNVEIHGKVANLTRVNGVKAEMYASDRATLINYINWAETGDIAGLECDINLAGESWTPLRKDNRFTATFDGQGHTISNMAVAVDWGYGGGFFSDMTGGCVIKNFTMEKASVTNTNGDKGNCYGIISGYAYGNATFENITITKSKIHAFGKVAGILGMAADPNGTTVVKNCKVEDTEIIGCYNVANYVGLVQNAIVLEGCTSTNVTKSIGGRYGEEAYVTFDNVKVVNDSDPANPKYVLSSGKYWKSVSGSNIYYYSAFADCYNDIHYDGWKALDGTVDGLVFNTPETPQPIDLEPVATIGSKKYYDLPSALAALQQGETLEIWQAGEYTVQTLSAPANSIIDAKVEGVVFNRTAGGSVTSYGTTSPVTVKNLTWNLGSNNYQYFNCKVENCTINGRPSIHTFASFKDCKLINTYASDYCITTYGSPCTFENCTFSSQGKFVNVYGDDPTPREVTATGCKFINLKESVNKAAFNIKGNGDGKIQHTHVIINNCTTEGLFPNHTTIDGQAIFFDGGLIMFDDPAWEADVYAVVDGITYYPYFSMDANGNYSVKNANGLKMAIKHWNALKAAGEKSITLADGTYNVSDMAIFQNYANKSLLIKAENEKQAVITPTAGSKQLIFVVAGMSKSYAGHITVDGLKFDMSGAANKTFESDVISISDAVGTNLPADEKALYSGTYHYGHDITVKNCEIIGLGSGNEHSSVVRTENQNAYNVKVQNCTIDKVGYVLTSKISTLAEVSGCTITDSKCVINSTVNNTEYKIIGNTISSYNNYCIRLDYGPIEVKDNNFNITWTKETGEIPTKHEPAIVVLRNSTGNKATITGNTSSKADDTMYDIYCKTSWDVNGTTIPAENGLSF